MRGWLIVTLIVVFGWMLIEENEGIGLAGGVDLLGSFMITLATMLGAFAIVKSTDYGLVSAELILEPTGAFSQQVTLGSLLTCDVGTYVVGDGFIHFTVTGHQPGEYAGKEMHWLTSFTYFYTPIDVNSMQLADRVAGTQWTMYRQ